MYLVICYSIHDQKIASVDKKNSYAEALDFLIKDAENTYNEEVANSGNNSSEIELDIDEDTATLNDYPAKCTWTWEIISV